MKKISISFFVILIALFYSFTITSDDVKERLGVKGPLEFSNTSFNLTWTDKPRDNYYIQEYLPAGETFESFNQMMTIHLFLTNMSVKEAVDKKITELENRKRTDILCNSAVSESPDGTEYLVDFILSESKGDEMTIAEFNVYRYKNIDIGNNEKGIIVYAYTKRSYGENIDSFLSKLKDERQDNLNQMVSVDIPSVTIQDK